MRRRRIQPDRHEFRNLVAGEVLRGDHHDLARRALQLLQAPADQLDRRQLRDQPIVVGGAVLRALAVEQPRGVRPRLLDEGQQHLGRHRDPSLVVIPRPRRETQATRQLRSAVLAEELLPDLPEAPG